MENKLIQIKIIIEIKIILFQITQIFNYNILFQNQNNNKTQKHKITVQYAADLPVSKHGSGFPMYQMKGSSDQHFNYKQNLFNLNNIYKSPNSILQIAQQKKQFISGITTPWVYMGMQFSTFCWHVQDLWLNSLNYSHKGSIKTWYIIPSSYKQKFDKFVEQKTGTTQILDRITYMLDPLEILKAGIKVYKTYQNPGEYVCTFFKAYHAGFSQGFNIGEAVNFVTIDSLKVIKQAEKNYSEKYKEKKPSVLSLQWLVHQNVRKQIFLKSNLITHSHLLHEYQNILSSQQKFLSFLSKQFIMSPKIQLIDYKFKYDKNSCTTCRKYCYLSSVKCTKCMKNYCENHVKNCCNAKLMIVIREADGKRKGNIEKIQKMIKENKEKNNKQIKMQVLIVDNFKKGK